FADGIGRRDNTEKIFMESSSSYNKEDFKHIDARYESVLKLAVFGVQCIRDRITLMKTTFGRNNKWHVMELRSAVIPTTWDKRSNMMKVLELLICLYVSTL
ncbi:hypothetical protein BDA99DRAFT_422207, partial [Phascolomyces articulosus]